MRLNLYNGKEQKEHIDEGVERLMAKNGWNQTFVPEFTHLGFGFGAVAVALFVWYLEKTVPFRDSRFQVGLLCLLYFTLISAAWLYQRYVVKNAMYIGLKGNYKLWVATKNPKNSDNYEMKIQIANPEGVIQTKDITYTIPELVDTTGIVHEEKLFELVEFVKKSEERKKND